MPRNIFGLVDEEGITNPLTQDIQGADFNIYDINELHINELHDQDGIDKIAVHEDFNMLNNRVTNMADPTQNKDAVTLGYAESNFASQVSVPTSAPYDIYAAFGDETTPISIGIQPVVIQATRAFAMSNIQAFLTNGASVNNYPINVNLNGSALSFSSFPQFITAGDTISSMGVFSSIINLSAGDKLTIGMNADATASGLKVVFLGDISI
jgi:hypothetical protein